jgi:hypothetical protein
MFNICSAIDHVKDDSTVPDKIKFDLYMFRVQIQLLVKNLGYAIEDLKSALFYEDDEKANLLLIDCYMQQEAFEKAKTAINKKKKKAIELQEKETLDKYKQKEAEVKNAEYDLLEKLQKQEVFKNLENDEKMNLYQELNRRGIKMKQQYHKVPANCESSIYKDDYGKYHFPILIIYEEFNTTDYIKDIDENTLISDIMELLLKEKLPWDKENKYNENVCKAFFEVSDFDKILKKESNYYYPLKNDDKLIDILTSHSVYMNGFPVIIILSQLSGFYNHFIKNKIILKRK